MDKIEYVRILSEREIIEFQQYLKKKVEVLSDLKVAVNHSDALSTEYQLLEHQEVGVYREKQLEIIQKYHLWDQKTCKCGKKLTFIESHGFWGCPDYRNDSIEHLSFQHNHDEILTSQFQNNKVRINTNWCTNIIDKVGIRGQLRAKTLLEYFESIGLEDLRSKYGYKKTLDTISSYINANQKSKSEEKEIYTFLVKHFTRVSYQTYIKYKIINQYPKVKIIDIIASDENIVYLIEVKRHNIYIDLGQIQLYERLLSYLLKEKNDIRSIKKIFVVNEKYESILNFNKCILYDTLKELKTKQEIVNLFDSNIIE